MWTPTEPLRVNIPGTSGEKTLTFSDSVLVGRGESCDLRLDDEGIHHQHAEIYRVGHLWWVRDLGSDDGTYLDEELIDAAPLSRASVVKLGSSGPSLRFS